MNIILFDAPEVRENLLPLSFTRPVADFRVGITTIRQKWETVIAGDYSYLTADYLSEKYAMVESATGDNLFVAGHIIPDYGEAFREAVLSLRQGEALAYKGETVAYRGDVSSFKAANSPPRRSGRGS